jgi:hypothetical protein
MNLLIGSTFPLSLIRRKVSITPESLTLLKTAIASTDKICSFWGHQNTLNAVNSLLGTDLTPLTERPSLLLNSDNMPVLCGEIFNECWVVSPNYISGFRPQIGVEVKKEEITGWEILKIIWGEN